MLQPSPRILVATAVAAAALLGAAGGVVLEDRQDLVSTTSRLEAAPRVAVGAIADTVEQPDEAPDFELPVFNASSAPIRVSVVGFDGLVDTVRPEPPVAITPRTWGNLPFNVAVNCDTGAAEPIRRARLRLHRDGGHSEVSVAVPAEGEVLLHYHRDLCRQGPLASASRLHGVWMLDRGYGENLEGYLGLMMWWFGRNGSFVADPEGGLFTSDPAIFGTYRVRGDVLTIDVDGGYACDAGAQAVWRIAVDGNGRMTLGWLRGQCPDGEPSDLWVMRRVLRDAGLPEP